MTALKIPTIEIQNLTFAYGKKNIFEQASMKVMPGQVAGIIGLSGSGKTTLIRLINGAMAREGRYSHEGKIFVEGQEASDVDHLNQLVGTVYQDVDNQLIFTNVVDEIVFGMENHCYSRELMDHRLTEVTSLLGLEHLLDKNPNQLSGGEKQLVVLASILCLDVSVLILDEAMSGVDTNTRARVLAVIEQMKKDGKAVLMIEHNMDNLSVADCVYKVVDGQLIQQP